MSIPKRVYNSSTRQAQAAKTRERILAAARKLFQEQGFELVTIDHLAKAAKVSSPTIYALFQSKRGILHALLDQSFPSRESLVEQAQKEKSPEKRLALAAKIARQMYDAEKQQIDMFSGAMVLAPEFKKLAQEREQRRYKRLKETLHTLTQCLPEDLTLTQAHDILWAFTGRDMYRLFVVERNWSPEDYEQWLTQLLKKVLLKS